MPKADPIDLIRARISARGFDEVADGLLELAIVRAVNDGADSVTLVAVELMDRGDPPREAMDRIEATMAKLTRQRQLYKDGDRWRPFWWIKVAAKKKAGRKGP